MDYDVIIVGGGVTGCSVARYLSRYDLSVCLLEKGDDVCHGTSKANSGIVHSGYDPVPGTLKAKLNIRGTAMMPQLARELDFKFIPNGSMIICRDPENLPALRALYDRGIENGVPGMVILSGEETRELEPNLSEDITASLLCPSGGIVDPFGLNIALAENAFTNGVEFLFEKEVTSIKPDGDGYTLSLADNTSLSCRYVVNAAGLWADRFHNQVSKKHIRIIPRRGNYMLCDKEEGDFVSHTIFQLPTKMGKGVLVTPTVDMNLLLGPTGIDNEQKEDTATYPHDLDFIKETAALSVKGGKLPLRSVITSFSGLRAHEVDGDFIIGEVEDAPGFFDAAGIESPGLSCSPAIGEYLATMIAEKAHAVEKENFIPTRKGILRVAELPPEERNRLIKEKPEYGKIVCRCEEVSEGEIIDAITRPLGARSLDGIKRRTRAGAGRCQAGFCTPRTMELLSEKLNIPMNRVRKNVKGSELVEGELR